MRYIDLSEIDTADPQVRRWLEKAHQATEDMRQAANHTARCKYLKDHAIWRDFKEILIKYYGHVCWYSECALTRSYGDVDHFRQRISQPKRTESVSCLMGTGGSHMTI